jgi:predicted phage baseplate assembly protein
MPITVAPVIDDRKYQDLLDEALARIPVHNPEWTNFNRSDPGVTLIELFAFLTENLLYRANQIPERNRRKFLSLLGVPLEPGASASGLFRRSRSAPTSRYARARSPSGPRRPWTCCPSRRAFSGSASGRTWTGN